MKDSSQFERRLTPIDRRKEILPWRYAESLSTCFLYWMPVSVFPVTEEEKAWLTVFLGQLADRMSTTIGVRGEVFLQLKLIYPNLMNVFLRTSKEFHPFIGLSRRPGTVLPAIPTLADLQPLIEGKVAFNFGEYFGDYCYWFVNKAIKRQCELFLGYGGMTFIFLKPHPNAPQKLPIPPKMRGAFAELFKQIDVDQMFDQMHAFGDGFLPKSKALFGEGLESDPQFPGLYFIIPLLSANDFFSRPAEEVDKWFQLFDLYVNESLADKGIVLASKLDLEEHLITIVQQMRIDGFVYPER